VGVSGAKLLDEPPIPLLPSVAKAFGLNEGIVLQQLHWVLRSDRAITDADGMRWVKAGLQFWGEQFPWWSEATIKRTFDSLVARGFVKRQRGREANTYAIDHAVVTAHLDLCSGSDCADETAQNAPSPCKREQGESSERKTGDEPPALFEQPPAAKPPSPAPTDDSKVEDVWAEYAKVFAGRFRVGLNDDKRKLLRKALKAVDDDAELCKRAIHGLKSYRERHPDGSKDVSLGAIFQTRPGGRVLSEQIEFWASEADSNAGAATRGIDPGVPAVLRDRIVRRRIIVQQAVQQPHNETLQAQSEEALAWLREHAGLEPVITDGRVEDWVKIK
jgi:hypothetical protein